MVSIAETWDHFSDPKRPDVNGPQGSQQEVLWIDSNKRRREENSGNARARKEMATEQLEQIKKELGKHNQGEGPAI